MTHFTGICTFPHGGFVSAGLLLAACAALVATTYSVASCRIVVLSFLSDTGNFEQSFSRFSSTQTDGLREYKVALGLFQWLRSTSDTKWDEGTCVGYQQTMKSEFSEIYFEVARIAGSMAVMLSVVAVLWSFVNTCIAWNMYQIIILSVLLLAGTVASGLAFVFLKSDICNNIFPESSCSIDEGGLVLVAGAILWLASFLITVIFMRTLDDRVNDVALSHMERERARQMSLLKEKRARERERQRRQKLEEQQKQMAQAQATVTAPTAISFEEEEGGFVAVTTPATLQSYSFEESTNHRAQSPTSQDRSRSPHPPVGSPQQRQDEVTVSEATETDEYEVYINSRMQRIDEILKDIQDAEERSGVDQDTASQILRDLNATADAQAADPYRYAYKTAVSSSSDEEKSSEPERLEDEPTEV